MLAKVQRTEQGLVIPVTAEMAQSLALAEGAEVDILPVTAAHGNRHATVQEALTAFDRTLPQHENAYRELAK
jgi:hypothetical protein